jgi:4,5-DOPA dioxygenase extradiol
MADILPAIFFGHGNPMNAVLDNVFTKGWSRIGQTTPKPKAILSVSAHWFVSETGVTIAAVSCPWRFQTRAASTTIAGTARSNA